MKFEVDDYEFGKCCGRYMHSEIEKFVDVMAKMAAEYAASRVADALTSKIVVDEILVENRMKRYAKR